MQPCCDKARPAQAEGESTPGKLTARSWRSTGPSSPLKQRPRGAQYGAAEESLAQAVWRGGRVRERHGKRFHVAGTSDQYWLGKRPTSIAWVRVRVQLTSSTRCGRSWGSGLFLRTISMGTGASGELGPATALRMPAMDRLASIKASHGPSRTQGTRRHRVDLQQG